VRTGTASGNQNSSSTFALPAGGLGQVTLQALGNTTTSVRVRDVASP
jgi:hypothetical protein